MKRVKGHSELLKSDDGVVLMTDKAAVLNKVEKLRKEKQKFEKLEQQMESLQNQLQMVIEQLQNGNNK